MAASLDTKRLGLVFQSRPDILDGIRAAADSPARVKLFNNIANFVYDQLQSGPEPAAKRRRVDDSPTNGLAPSTSNGNALNGVDPSKEPVLLEVKEISVSVPQRKKFDLCFTANHLYARAPGSTAPAPGIVYAWKDIEYAFYLPVPEKAQVQHNYILFPRGTCISALKSGPANPSAAEPLVFTVPATAPKQGTIAGPDAAKASAFSDAYQTLLHWALKSHLRSAGNPLDITAADPNKFHSVIPQSHRPKEKAVHVKAFRGSKDGYLFFLQNGVLWGYKKPLMFIPLDRIAAVSYTSVLQRTFNMVIEVFVPGEEQGGEGEGTEEVEFAMLDQADFGGIDEAYVKKNRLQDRSMAERRKAKLELAENAKAGKKAGAGEDPEGGHDGAGVVATDAAEDGMTELERAQLEAERKLQDEEDEDEEDYDPGSDGDSDGSGSSDDDSDDDDGDDDQGDEDEDEDGEGEEGEGGEEEDDEAEGEEEEEEQEAVEEQKKPKSATQAGLVVEDEEQYDAMDVEEDEDERFDVVG